jgi:uncharacterized protein with HEPN domain
MPRDFNVYLEDILQSIRRIQKYVDGRTWSEASNDDKTFDAVVRNIEVIGEAVKHLPDEITNPHKSIEWRKIAGMRDIIAHEYFGVDAAIIGDVVEQKLPELELVVLILLEDGRHPTAREKNLAYRVPKTRKKATKSKKLRRKV